MLVSVAKFVQCYSGVGTGIAADALARHGIATTLIEIDPAVYNAARRFFGLKHPGDDKVFLEDARDWLHKRVATQSISSISTRKFDIVIHDCFSGGGVPKQLFSLEFWDQLKTIMTSRGVIAIVRLLLKVISTSLKGHCLAELRWETWIKVVTGCGDDLAQSIWTM